ncbi:hypothetical protein CWRG_02091 [Chthonomonas calidirosea]|uniref:hypothetical protein n=1 Tax=Chthonomonas calidirosea TaxID=454171 RepID=UPI0006DD54F0|nr:hypothetical protein [Chthonomonas calidirosea]CEK18212.1 hypothetical protein CWRG_02091 [Chthonomonas calidirosea]CEK18215.1 hypothetical protein CP488_02106 [Chthonomonas calidirosea]
MSKNPLLELSLSKAGDTSKFPSDDGALQPEAVAPPSQEVEQPQPLPPQQGTRLALLGALGLVGLYLLAAYLPDTEFYILLSTLLALPLTLLFAIGLVSALSSPKALLLNTVLSFALFLPRPLLGVLQTVLPLPKWVFMVTLPYFLLSHFIPGADTLLLIWCACCIGHWLSRLVRERKMLLPISVALALVDIFTVFGGGVVTQATHAPKGQAVLQKAAMATLTAKLPTSARGAAPMQLAVGFADFLFVAFFFACFQRLGMSLRAYRATIIALLVVLTGYLAFVFLFSTDLPALVPIAVVVIAVNWRAFRYSRSERFALLYAGLALVVFLGLAIYFLHK